MYASERFSVLQNSVIVGLSCRIPSQYNLSIPSKVENTAASIRIEIFEAEMICIVYQLENMMRRELTCFTVTNMPLVSKNGAIAVHIMHMSETREP